MNNFDEREKLDYSRGSILSFGRIHNIKDCKDPKLNLISFRYNQAVIELAIVARSIRGNCDSGYSFSQVKAFLQSLPTVEVLLVLKRAGVAIDVDLMNTFDYFDVGE